MSDRVWIESKVLQAGKCYTRDGRIVFDLKRAILDDREILIGKVTIGKPPFAKKGIVKTERHYWERGGLGTHGGDDLVLQPPMQE